MHQAINALPSARARTPVGKPPVTETPLGRVENSASQSARPWADILKRALPNWGRRHAAANHLAPKCNALARANAPQLATGA
eukprot:13035654-Alexandrium_andersonii.AAC.1